MNAIEIESLNDIEQIEQTETFDELLSYKTTYEAIEAGASINPNKTAISFFLSGDNHQTPHRVTYNGLLLNITKTANFFDSIGLGSDDVVAFILPNLPETHYVIWGGEARCQVLAINPLLEADQICDLVNSTGAKAVVTMNPMKGIDLWPKLSTIFDKLTGVEHVIGIDIAHYVTGVKGLIAGLIQSHSRRKITLPQGLTYHHFNHVITQQNGIALGFSREISDETISSLYCTGGTTGLPKIARRTHRNELANSLSVQLATGTNINQSSVILGGLPLFHVNGALVTGLIPFSIGASIVIATPQGYRGENVIAKFWDIIEHFRVTTFSGVPTVYSALMNYSTQGKDLSSLALGICGAAPMPIETFKSFQEKTGIKILEGYGCTEGTCVSSLNPFHGEQKIGSIGIRLPFQEMKTVKIVENQIAQECGIDEIGALVIKGPNVFLGYQQSQQNEGVFVIDSQGETWLNTGDLARKDSDGYFWLTGRKKELIVRGGHNIEPKMIEEAMCKHPQISLAAAVGKPDEHAGEVPVCYVQVESHVTLDENELMAFAQQEVPERAAIPKAIHIVEELPVTAVGKVFKPQLEMQEIEKCIAQLAKKDFPHAKVSINVVQDPVQGILARVSLPDATKEDKASFTKLLGKYTFKSTLS